MKKLANFIMILMPLLIVLLIMELVNNPQGEIYRFVMNNGILVTLTCIIALSASFILFSYNKRLVGKKQYGITSASIKDIKKTFIIFVITAILALLLWAMALGDAGTLTFTVGFFLFAIGVTILSLIFGIAAIVSLIHLGLTKEVDPKDKFVSP